MPLPRRLGPVYRRGGRPWWLFSQWKSGRQVLQGGLMVLAALVLQGVWAPALRIGFAMPDFGLAVLACLALMSNPSGGAWIGFLVGLIEGAMIAQTLGSHLLSRTIAGFLAGWVPTWFEREHPLMPILAGMLVVIVAELLLFLMAPRYDWAAWSLRVIGKTLYNGVLMLPLMLLIRQWVARELVEN